MRTPNEVVAGNVRRLRDERNLSLSEAARRAGLAKGTLSRLELGQVSPSIDTLWSIAAALEVSPDKLVAENSTPVTVHRDRPESWIKTDTACTRLLGRVYGSGLVRTFLLNVDQAGLHAPAHSPGVIEQVYVLDGELEIGPQGATHALTTGDFIRFPADRPHYYLPTYRPCLLHAVMTIPVPESGDMLDLDISHDHASPATTE